MFNEHSYYRDIQVMFSLLEGHPKRNMATVDKMSTVAKIRKNKKTLTSSGCT